MGYQERIAALPPVEITCTPGVVGGQPCIAGTRIPADIIRQYLADGCTKLEIFTDYPSLPVGGVEAVQRWAEANGLPCSAP